MEKNYTSYDAAQFLDDPFFMEWIKRRTPEAELFWNSWIQSNPHNLEAMREAEAQLRIFLSAQRINIGDEEEVLVWNRIQHSIDSPVRSIENSRSFSITRVMRKNWWAAAAILLVMATAGFFLWNQEKEKELVKTDGKHSLFEIDIEPGGNRAILTLADGTELVLDTAGNGALAKQGNVTIVKMNGQLSYNEEGSAAKAIFYNTITTPKGGQYQLELSDGTKVWLNASSSLRFPMSFRGSERRVEITGEAYFEVAKKEAMPFKVNVAGRGEVEVLGTHFNINAYDDEPAISATLIEGSIRFAALKNNEVKTIAPGEQVQLGADGQMKLNKHADIESVIAWKNGSFYFSNQDIVSIMRQVSRWYDVEVVYSGAISRETFTGIVDRASRVSEVLSIMEESGMKFKIEGKKIVVQF